MYISKSGLKIIRAKSDKTNIYTYLMFLHKNLCTYIIILDLIQEKFDNGNTFHVGSSSVALIERILIHAKCTSLRDCFCTKNVISVNNGNNRKKLFFA